MINEKWKMKNKIIDYCIWELCLLKYHIKNITEINHTNWLSTNIIPYHINNNVWYYTVLHHGHRIGGENGAQRV